MPKHIALFLLFFITFQGTTFGQDLVFNAQAELDGYNSNQSVVAGDLIIQGDNIVDLSNLSTIQTVEGLLSIRSNGVLENLNGLEGLNDVGGNVSITSNFSLLNIEGLHNLSRVGGSVTIDFKNLIQDLNGLRNLSTIGGSLTVSRNDFLQNLDGLENITFLEGNLTIGRNEALVDIDALSNLSNVGVDLNINENTSLLNVDGLASLENVGDDLIIELNPALQNLNGLSNLTNIQKNFWILENGALTDLTGLENLTMLNGDIRVFDNHNLVNLIGLDNISTANGEIRISGNSSLKSLNGLNKLVRVEGLLSISNNASLESISDLESLIFVGGPLSIGTHPLLKNLSGLENTTVVGSISITRNDILENLNGLINIKTVEDRLTISSNHALIDLSGLDNITSIENDVSITFNNALLSVDGFQNLDSVGGSFSVSSNPVLQNVNGLENLVSLGDGLWVQNNLSLRNCCGIQALVTTPDAIGGSLNLNNNPMECSSPDLITIDCFDLASASGCIYWDENQNGTRETGERSLPLIVSTVAPTNIFSFLDTAGCFTYFLENNNYDLSYIPSPYWQLSSDSAAYQINVNDNFYSGLDFGFIPVDSTLAGGHTSTSGIPRCNNNVQFDFNFKNEGNTVLDGRLFVELDSTTTLSYFVHPVDSIINDNSWEWYFEDLYPGDVLQRTAFLRVPGVEIDSINIFSAVGAKTDFHPEIFFKANYDTPILCAYDPNDKLVFPDRAGDENYTLFDESLTYTVRFQNTGNDTAFTVVIQDTLSNFLDASTLSILASSHRNILSTELREGQFLSFTFEDILLPDSTTNFDGSQGYVTYRIQPLEGLEENTLVENTASIYFDFNPPIVTNTTRNTFVECLPIPSEEVTAEIVEGQTYTLPDGIVVDEAGTYTTDILNEEGCPIETIITVLDVLTSTNGLAWNDSVTLSPNPTSDKFLIEIDLQEMINHQLLIIDVDGREVESSRLNSKIKQVDIQGMDSGVYYVHVRNNLGELLFVRRLVVLK